MKLILVRHGETRLNKEGRIQGVGAAPLNATGRAQAHAAGRALQGDLPLALYTSPIARALETAQIMSKAFNVTLAALSGLEEADAGELEGLNGSEMRERYPDFAQRWAQDSATTQMPAGESLLQVEERAWRAVSRLLDLHAEDTVVAVTHNFTIQTIICKVLDLPLHNSRRLRHDLGAISRLELSRDHGALVSLNETWHLQALADEPAAG